jgi:membrane-associated HD superfamily phosphohydrolase
MSALIIAAHVKDGVELGKKYGLPESVLRFIPEHHGKTRISFFYDKAIKQAARRPGKERINEQDFLYPGPKPQSKETAIVMLSDTVEATTRAIGEMTIQKLENVIENLIRQRFIEGQLDECDLTLRDLSKIKEAFLKILVGIHHQRLVYPTPVPLDDMVVPPEPSAPAEVPVEAPVENSADDLRDLLHDGDQPDDAVEEPGSGPA